MSFFRRRSEGNVHATFPLYYSDVGVADAHHVAGSNDSAVTERGGIGLTHRRMRDCLLKTFTEIYILNLHGNQRTKEAAPDHSRDENVFDIQQV
jgi:hypothetical protein